MKDIKGNTKPKISMKKIAELHSGLVSSQRGTSTGRLVKPMKLQQSKDDFQIK